MFSKNPFGLLPFAAIDANMNSAFQCDGSATVSWKATSAFSFSGFSYGTWTSDKSYSFVCAGTSTCIGRADSAF